MELGVDFDPGAPGFQNVVTVPVGTIFTARVKLAENNSPLPTDRIYFDYAHFDDAISGPAITVIGPPVVGDIAALGSIPGLVCSFTATVDRIANPLTVIAQGTALAVDVTSPLELPFTERVGFINLGTFVDLGVWDFDNLVPPLVEMTIMSISFQAVAPGTVTMALLPPAGATHLSNDGLPVPVDLLTATVVVVDPVPLPTAGALLTGALVLLRLGRRKPSING